MPGEVSTICNTFIIWIIIVFYINASCMGNLNGDSLKKSKDVIVFPCPENEELCSQDKLGYEAIQLLHFSIDDDRNGNLDRSESDEFIRDELHYEDGFDRQVNFHGSDDQISVIDLWHLWTHSEVYNWTCDDVLDWVANQVELPQYIENFRINAVDGHILPRIAVNGQYMTSILGIENKVHKSKLQIKSTDAVLFGPPKKAHNWLKDLALVLSIVIALGGCWLAYIQNKYSQSHLKKVMEDLDSLQKANDSLAALQSKLDKAEQEQHSVAEEKKCLEMKMKDEIDTAKAEANRLKDAREATEEEICRLKFAEDELVQLRSLLKRAEKQLEEHHNAPLAELQKWLQLTYEIESRHFETKKEAAERQLQVAKEMYTKLGKRRTNLLGSLRLAHTGTIDSVDRNIIAARAALEDVKLDLQERSNRWKEIEQICGFCIINNPGLQMLELTLRSGAPSHHASNLISSQSIGSSMMTANMEDADEDMPPGVFTSSRASRSSIGSTDHRVWPNLMQAGMQLTMLGLNLTHKNLVVQPISAIPRDYHRGPQHSLASAFGSSNSLNVGAHGVQSLGRHAQSAFLPLHSMVPSEYRESQSEDEGAPSVNGSVRFNLGEQGSISPTDEDMSITDNTENKTFVKSQSMEVKSTQQTLSPLRPSTSDTSISKTSPKGGVHKRITKSRSPNTVKEEDNSSHESTDSVNLESKEQKPKKKKLFTKFLRTDKGDKKTS